MSAHCCDHDTPQAETIGNLPRYRKILWIALIVNAAMFLVEIGAGVQAGSLSLLADAVGIRLADQLYQQFKWDIIARLPYGGWELRLTQVRDWVKEGASSA